MNLFLITRKDLIELAERNGSKGRTLISVEGESFYDDLSACTYDSQGNILTQVYSYGERFTYTYDDKGNRLTQTSCSGRKWTYTYDSRGNRLTEDSLSGDCYTYKYDSHGNMTTKTRPNGDQWTYIYDHRGNMTIKTRPNGGQCVYSYDAKGNILQIIYPNGDRSFFTHEWLDSNTFVRICDGDQVIRATFAELSAKKFYIIQDKEAGNLVDEFGTLDEAEKALSGYEQEDKNSGEYSTDFYEILESVKDA